MKTTQDLRNALNACKATGRWARIAAVAGCDYNYLTRIARGASAPSLDMAVKLFAALDDAGAGSGNASDGVAAADAAMCATEQSTRHVSVVEGTPNAA